MLSYYAGPIGTAATIFPLIAGTILLPVIVIHYWRFGQLRQIRALVFYSLLFYALAAYFLVILPLPDRFEGFCEFYAQSKAPRLQPFSFVGDMLSYEQGLSDLAFVRSLPSNPAFLQAFFNFLLLLPLGFYLRYYFHYSIRRTLFVAFAVTLFFELTQLSGLYGLYPCPYRLFDVDDLILNASGAMVGYSLAAVMPFLPRLNKKPTGQIPVTIVRRSVAFVLDVLLFGIAFGIVSGILLPPDHLYETLLNMLSIAVWFIVIPAIWHGYTPGKRLVFLRIVSRDGSHVGLWQLAIRYGALLVVHPLAITLIVLLQLSALLEFAAIAAATLAYLALVIGRSVLSRDGRGLHDTLSGTRQTVSWQSYRDTLTVTAAESQPPD